MKTILMFPQARTEENFYLGNLSCTLSDDFKVVGVNEIFSLRKLKFLFCFDACHVNWLENVKGKSSLKRYLQFFIRFVFICFVHFSRKPLIWTVHNKQPHNLKKSSILSNILMKMLAKWSTKIHVLCSRTVDAVPLLQGYKEKIICIPHGDYFSNYGSLGQNIREKYGIDETKKIIFFVGKIGPYKNVDLILKSFIESRLFDFDYVLLLCGKCEENQYKDYLESLCVQAKDAVYWDFHFIPNEAMGDYLNQIDIMIVPYDRDSILNSGTAWMAFSFGKTILCPRIEGLMDIPYLEKIAFIYDYQNADEHLPALISCVSHLKNETKESLRERGFLAKEEMKKKSWQVHKNSWKNLYR